MIRQAESADLEFIRDCADAAYRMYVARIGRKPAPMVADFATAIENGSVYLFVDDGGTPGGYVICYPRGDHLHLENVAVLPGRQGEGIGSSLLAHAERCALDAGLDSVQLYTNAKMTENLALYPRLGYRQFDRHFEDGFDRVYFRKRLR